MQPQGERQDCLAGGGEMGALMRSIDWSATPIGTVEAWSPALRTMVRMLLVNRFQLFVWWGPRYVQIYNDAAWPILGAKHPRSMGQPASECWSEIWHVIGPLIDAPFRGGPATWMEDIFLEINRYGAPEETHFTIAYSPVPDETAPGGIGGVLATVHEITGKVVGERRVMVLRDLGAGTAAEAKTAEEACITAARALTAHDKDVPFALIYLLDADGRRAVLAAASGVAEGEAISPRVVALHGGDVVGWPLAEVLEAEAAGVVTDLADRFGAVPPGPWSDRPGEAVVLPIPSTRAHRPAGLLICGVSARLRFDEPYRGFLELVAGQIGTAIANARSWEEEKKRAEALAELDRAKTAFFSNVSHEFRTPLTLILGPVEDALADPVDPLPLGQRERLEAAHRSSLRLLKLVNTLLDFARIEAGRIRATYEPTDLAALTAELASNFRSACQRAGLRLVVDCPPLPEPVFVDRDMWEKVVLNLLSNAIKFTLEGEVAVRLRPVDGAAELAVRDTGTGIPAGELPRIFERFHRVEGSRGRTHEGTGIGLALVQELVKLHGGSVRAESTLGEGSTFTVTVPRGSAHLPADRVGAPRELGPTEIGAGAFVEEALRWLPDEEWSRAFPGSVGNAREAFPTEVSAPHRPHLHEPDDLAARRPRILWADDNADMRHYVRRLLGRLYDVEAVPDGEAALAAARARPPDLVLSDVMMPRLDGFGLLGALRADPATRTIPVILLSARAGEESRVEGLKAGADDYLVKPFSARELLARVGAHLEMGRVRREAERRVTSILESITDGFVSLDREWRYTYVNATAEASLGIHRDRLLGRCLWEEFPETVGGEIEQMCRKAVAESVTVDFDTFYAPHGRWYACRAFPSPAGLSIYFRDISEHRQAEAGLRRSEARFRRYFELGLIGMAITSPTKGCLEVNDEICRILGYSRDELLRKTWAEITHPDDLAADVAQFDRVMAGEIDGYTMDKRWIRRDGRAIDSTISVKCVRRDDGSVDYMLALLEDVTEQKHAESALRESEARFRNMADHAPVGVWVTDARAHCTYVNEWWCRFTGTTPGQGLEFGWLKSAHPDDRDRILEAFRAANERRASFRLEYRVRRHDGEFRWALDTAAPRLGPTGEFLGYIGSVLDITEEKRKEEALRRSEAMLAEAQQIAHTGSWSWDLVTDEIIASDECYRIVGLRPREAPFSAERAAAYIHPEDREGARESVRRAIRDRQPYEWCLRMVREDGTPLVVLSRGQAAYDRDGDPVRMSGTIQDVTERTRAEEALHRDALVLANVSDSVIATDLEGTITFWNEGATRLFGWTAREMVGRPYADRFPEPERSWIAEQIRSRREGTEWAGEYQDHRKDGSRAWIDARVRRVTDAAGRPHGIIGIARDITDRKAAEEALRDSEARLAADLAGMKRLQEVSTRLVHEGDPTPLLLEIVDAAIGITAADMGNVQLYDRASDSLRIVASRGFRPQDLELFAVIHRGDSTCGTALERGERVVVGDVAASAIFAGKPMLEAVLAAGIRALLSTPLISRSGRLVGMLSTHYRAPRVPEDRDLHILDLLARQAADWIERMQAAEDLRQAKEAAEASNRSKDEFLANVSHEIRTPFGAILGMTELVLDSPLTDDQRECLETVKSAAVNLLGLVEDLLDFEKIEAGKLELATADFSLRAALGDTVRILAGRAEKKGLKLLCRVGPDVPDALAGDAARLRQVLLNLVGNAIKFTMTGEVAVRVELAGEPAPAGEIGLRFAVRDTGIGIPPEGRERIFRAFEQADNSTTRRYGGTGLGLSIAARLVGLMGGTIGVESEPGRGSTFSFTARFGRQSRPSGQVDARPPVAIPEAAPGPGVRPLRILVAEDSEFNSRHLMRLLGRWGHTVRVATDGREALNRTGEVAFDLLLLDVHMPELDGFQVVRAIRERERAAGGHLPVIALTARARKEDRDRCLAAGMDDYLSKPVRVAELFAAIDRVVTAAGRRPDRPGDADVASLLDPAALLAASDGDEEGLREICRDFRAYAPARLAEVGDALQARDAPRLREAAHKFCGLISAFSAVAGDVAADLEDHAARSQLDEAGPLVVRLESMVRDLSREVDDISPDDLRRRTGAADPQP